MMTRSLRFKHLDTKELYAGNVLASALYYQTSEHPFDELENGEGWRIPYPDYSEFSEQELRKRFQDYKSVFNPTQQVDEDRETFLERFRTEAGEWAAEHMEDLSLEPMLNYFWPLGDYADADMRADFTGEPKEVSHGVAQAILDVYGLNVCLVLIDGKPYLGITGAGSDMSWDIAEGYTLMGYLPPADLELHSGEYRTTRNLRTMAAMRKSYTTARDWMGQKLRRLRNTQQTLAELPTKK